MFTKILYRCSSVRQAYCCYCYCSADLLLLLFNTGPAIVQLPIFDCDSAKTLRSALFSIFSRFKAILRRFQAIYEAIPSDFERLEHRNQRETKRFASGRPNVGGLEPSVGLLLFMRLTVHHCCSPGPLLFCCYC